jgi:arylamine N-acetyltransferase
MKKASTIFIIIVFLFITLHLKTLDTWMPADIRLDTGDTPGANNSYDPQIACIGDNVYAVWEDYRNGYTDIFFNYSTDKGANWLSSPIRLDTGDTAGANYSTNPQITFSGNNVYVVWQDRRNGTHYDIYFNYSTDGGANWNWTDFRLDTGDTAGVNNSLYPQIACFGNNLYVIWQDYRNGSCSDIYFNYSADNGATWQSSDIRLDTGDTAGSNDSKSPKIACSANNVYAVWEDWRNGIYLDIYFNYSADNGVNWQSSDIRVDTGDAAGTNDSWEQQISCSGNNVYVVWVEYRNGSADVFFNYSVDSGANWQSSAFRVDTGDTPGANNSYSPQMTCFGNNVYAVWQDYRNSTTNADIYFNYSTDYGATWQASAIRLDTGDTAGTNSSNFPQIDCSVENIYVIWMDYRNGTYRDIYFNYSRDEGANWSPTDFRLDTGTTEGTSDSTLPQVACTGTNVYAIWQDYRNGSYADIYFNRAIPWVDIKANGSDGPISITQSDTLQIRVSLNTFGSTENVDYWLAYKGPSGWVHFNNSTKKWEAGLGVTHQGPLMDLNNKKVFQSKLSPGNYTFYFGVDMNMDGKLTKSELYYDEVKVTVTQ